MSISKSILKVTVSFLGLMSVLNFAVAADPNDSWNTTMQEMAGTLSKVLTDVSSDSRFSDPKNEKTILENATKLSEYSHKLKASAQPKDNDPTVPMLLDILARETLLAKDELKRKNSAYAREILRSVPSYCIGCHTRNESTRKISFANLMPTLPLSAAEQGNFYAASQQYDRAIESLMSVINDPKAADQNIYVWEKAVRQSIGIAVRVKQDPELTKKIVESVINADFAPIFIKADAKKWLRSVKEWSAEKPKTLSTSKQFHVEALRLMNKAKNLQKFAYDRGGDIEYLRATANLHHALSIAKNGKPDPETLLLLGLSYEVLSPYHLNDLPKMYYELCIRKNPHTFSAENCYLRYEAVTYLGFSGSSGVHLPQDVIETQKELESLAYPKPVKSNPN